MERNKLNKLKRGIKGNMKQVAELSNVSQATVSRVLNGHQFNDTVIESAIKVRNTISEKKKQLESQI